MTRLLTANILLPAVLAVVWFLPPLATLALALIAAGLAMVEYTRIAAALGARVPRITSLFVLGSCAATGSLAFPAEGILLIALVVIGSVAVFAGGVGPTALTNSAAAIFAVVYLGLPLGAIAAIRTMGGREAVVLLMITLVVSDSAQYYTGRAFGRVPLAPAISPKKTREGAIGGLIFGTAAMSAGGLYVFPGTSFPLLLLTAAAVVVLGLVGDLFESLQIRRSSGRG